MNYWVARGGQQQGPFSIADVQRMLAQGALSPNDLAWQEGMPQWLPISQVIPAAAPAPPPPMAAPPPAMAAQPMQPQYGYAPPQNPVPAQGYGYAQPANPAMRAGGPMPPNLHWALVWLFGALTFGIFTLVWIFIEAGFVKKLDPKNNATMLFVVVIVLEVGYYGLLLVTIAGGGGRDILPILSLLGAPVGIACLVCGLVAIFSMRRSLVNYYNYTEPIGLRLSGAMTFFFSILYFQHHFSRIAQWKTTGVLTPQ
jgi:hypothetical protein